jgi:hypothetical protein
MITGGALAATIILTGGAIAEAAGPSTDSVTGYRCVSPDCTTVRPEAANCICVKRNPGETNVNRLVLACSTKKDGHWITCPVKPRYGIPAR